MNLIRFFLVASLLFAVGTQAGNARYLTLLNRAHDSVIQVEVADVGSELFELRPIDAVEGGGGSTTVRLGASGCRFDVRLRFRDGRQVVYRGVDACKGDALVIMPPGRAERVGSVPERPHGTSQYPVTQESDRHG